MTVSHLCGHQSSRFVKYGTVVCHLIPHDSPHDWHDGSHQNHLLQYTPISLEHDSLLCLFSAVSSFPGFEDGIGLATGSCTVRGSPFWSSTSSGW